MAEAGLQERLTASDLFLLLWDDDGWRIFGDRVWLPRQSATASGGPNLNEDVARRMPMRRRNARHSARQRTRRGMSGHAMPS